MHCLSLPFHRPSLPLTALPPSFTAFSLPFHCLPVPFTALSRLPFHCPFTVFQYPFIIFHCLSQRFYVSAVPRAQACDPAPQWGWSFLLFVLIGGGGYFGGGLAFNVHKRGKVGMHCLSLTFPPLPFADLSTAFR